MKCPTCKGAGRMKAKDFASYNCHDCCSVYATYMAREKVWHAAIEHSPDKRAIRYLCLHCLERRLGRPLTIDDFTSAPINDGIRLGHALGVLAYERKRREKAA